MLPSGLKPPSSGLTYPKQLHQPAAHQAILKLMLENQQRSVAHVEEGCTTMHTPLH